MSWNCNFIVQGWQASMPEAQHQCSLPLFKHLPSKFPSKCLSPHKLAALFFLNCFLLCFIFLKKKVKPHHKIQTQPQPNQCYQTLGKLGWMTRVFQRNLFCTEVNFKHFSSLPDDLILGEPMKDKALQRSSNYFPSCSQNMFCWDKARDFSGISS